MFPKQVRIIRLFPLLLSLSWPTLVSAGADSLDIPFVATPAVRGETCTVCGIPLTETDIALTVRGRRVPLKREMVDQFLSSPEKYFARLQPRGALFQEDGQSGSGEHHDPGVDFFWFAAGLYLLVALVFAGMSGYTAVSKGLDPILHFFIGLLFSAAGYLYVLTKSPAEGNQQIPKGLAKVATTRSPVRCEKCGALNHPSSGRCSGCGVSMIPQTISEVEKL